MKAISSCFLLIIFLFINIHAQTVFNRIYQPGNSADLSGNVVALDDGYMMCGVANLAAYDFYSGIRLVKTDFSGNEIWTKEYGKIGYGYDLANSGSFIRSINGYALAAWVRDTFGNADAVLIKFDENGDFEWEKTFGGVRNEWFSGCAQASNGDYVLIGYTASFGNAKGDYYLVKTDSLGNLKWQKTYGGSKISQGIGISIIDNEYILGGGSEIITGNYTTYIIKTDTAGNIKNTYSPTADKNVCGTGRVIITPDIDFVMTSCIDSFNNFNWLAYYIQKTDSSGNVLWRTFFKSQIGLNRGPRQAIGLPDGNFIICGDEFPTGVGWVIKLDRNGNILWERLHAYNTNSSNTLYDIKQTTDGGFICTGNAFEPGFSGSNFWLLKLDSLGCLGPDDCGLPVGIHEPATIHIKNAHIQIVPNPAQEQAIIAIKANDLPYQEVNIQLHELSGRLIHQNNTSLNGYGYGEYFLSKDNLPAGIYLISIHAEQGIIGRGKIVFQ